MRPRIGQFEELDLPDGERLIWQGHPTAKALALRVFHVRLVAAYFAALFAARVAVGAFQHEAWLDNVSAASRLAIPLLAGLALLSGLAFIYSRTTRYSVTNRRVLLQFGAVLPMTLNVPFKQIAGAAVKEYGDGSGDLPLTVVSEQRLAFLLLWPHVRPWRLTRVEPMLRCVPDAQKAAAALAGALKAAAPQSSEPVVTAMPAPRVVGLMPAVASAA